MSGKCIIQPTSEPVTLDEVKQHLRLTGADDDALLSLMISTAREMAEDKTGRAIMPQTWEAAYSGFDDELILPCSPLINVIEVRYLDPDGAWQVLAQSGYQIDIHATPESLFPGIGASWPQTRAQRNAVVIQFRAGYESAQAVPARLRNWILLFITTLYENRQIFSPERAFEVPGVAGLLSTLRIIPI